LGVAGEKADISAAVSKWKSGPAIDFSISSQKLSVDPLMAIFAAGAGAKKATPIPGELTKTVNRALASIPNSLNVNGQINLAQVSFMNFAADKAALSFSLANKNATADIKEIKFYEGTISGKAKVALATPGLGYSGTLKLSGFNASPFSNAVVETFLTKLPDYKDLTNKVSGTLDAALNFSGRGVEVPDILANAVGAGSFILKDGELKKLKTIGAIADKINTPALKQDLKVSELSGNFELKNQVVAIKTLVLKAGDLGANFNGGLDLKNLKYVAGNRLSLRGSPTATRELSKEYDLLRDSKGWLEATFELKGSLKTPIPYPILDKPIEKAIGKLNVKIEAEKVELEKKATQQVDAEKQRLEEEGKNKLKELFKF